MKYHNRGSALLALMLALALLLGCLTGCSNSKGMADSITSPATEDDAPQERASTNGLKPTSSSMKPEKKRPFTLIVYMIGSNLESDSACASYDLLEMAESGLNSGKVNLVVYTGGTTEWALNISASYNTLLLYDHADEELYAVATTRKNNNMGDPKTLTDVLQFTAKYFPADNYGLICWDHGGASIIGYGSDDLYNGDSLTLSELQSALKSQPLGKNKKFSFIGFDACLMGTLETANALAPYADYMIASEETEPGTGWDYSALGSFTGKEKIPDFAEELLDTYLASSKQYRNKPDMTLSCIDLSKLDAVNTAAASLFQAMDDDLNNDKYASISRTRGMVKEFAAGYGFDQVDLYHLASLSEKAYSTQAKALQKAVKDAVIYNVSNVRNAEGLSFYYPYKGDALYQYYAEALLDTLFPDASYATFVRDFMQAKTTGKTTSRQLSIPIPAQDQIELQLSDDELETLESAEYSIFERTDSGDYIPMVLSLPVTPDEDGVLRIDKVQDVVYLVTDADSSDVWSVKVVASEEDRIVLETLFTRVSSTPAHMPYMNYYNCTASFYVPTGYETGIVQTLTYDSDLGGDRNEIDLSLYDCLGSIVHGSVPTYGDDGSLLPFAQWEEGSWTWMTYIPVYEDFHFELRSLEDALGDYCVQFTIRDVYGNEHASELFDLEAQSNYKTVDVPADGGGTMTFAVFDDYASLAEITIDIETLDVPAEVEGKPVTHIRAACFNEDAMLSDYNSTLREVRLPDTVTDIVDNAFGSCAALEKINLPASLKRIGRFAFQNCTSLQTIDLPDGLEVIGDYAFAGCAYCDYDFDDDWKLIATYTGPEEITLPATLKELGPGAFTNCGNLKRINLASDLQGWHLTDGVLFTDDNVLVCYPAGLEDASYIVPADTIAIGEAAFHGTKLTSITLNEGLTRVENYAFFNCYKLTELTLPDSLEWIGDYGFGCGTVISSMLKDCEPLEELQIGGSLWHLGENALTALRVRHFVISDENESLTTDDDGTLLLDASGSVLWRVAETSGVLNVPDGVATVKKNAFDNIYTLDAVVFPDSTVTIFYQSELCSDVTLGAGLRKLNKYALSDVKTLTLSPDNEVFRLEDGKLVDDDGNVYWTAPDKD